MKNKIFITLFLNLIYLSSYSQLDVSSASKDEIPYNKETGLVSINNILILPDANKSLKDIKAQIASFFETNQNGGTKKPNRLSKKNKDKLPQFSAGITLNQDSLIIYDLQMELEYYHTTGGLAGLSQVGGDGFSYKLKLYLKKGKLKYDFTNFSHGYAWAGTYKGFTGGKFENEKPEKSDSWLSSRKADWLAMKADALFLVNNLAKAFEKSMMQTSSTKDFNF